MKYRVNIRDIFSEHNKAWNAVVGENKGAWDWPTIDRMYNKRCNAKLIRTPDGKSYEFIEFKNKGAYMLYMLEWS